MLYMIAKIIISSILIAILGAFTYTNGLLNNSMWFVE